MKRLHVNLGVKDLASSVAFYTELFGAAPDVLKDDYAKWLLDDPAVNFAVTSRCGGTGVDHLGIQAESEAELQDIAARMRAAGRDGEVERNVTCCYARQDKAWIADPQGVKWEAFRTFEQDGLKPSCASLATNPARA